jgi:hypothetical protein
MLDNPETIALARVVHRLWTERMLSEGWRLGDDYCAESKTHDSLVPFDHLPRRDRLVAQVNLECAELIDHLVKLVAPDRTPDAPFGVEDLHVGLTVGAADVREADAPAEPGVVESWEVDDDGDVTEITVRWADGSIEEFNAFERLIRRLSD